MAAQTLPHTRSYKENHVGGDGIGIFGDIYGDIQLPDRSSRDPYLHTLNASDPRVKKDRIKIDKDKLLSQCYSWILDNKDFQY
jgi:hypothetical protein